jgi:oligoribonuclease
MDRTLLDEIPSKIFWVDLEMTGLDVNKDVIIEVAAEVTDLNFTTIASYEACVLRSDQVLGGMNQWAMEHHAQSGLIERIKEQGKSDNDVQHELIGFINAQFNGKPAILAGNSIHNDRNFIKKWWPEVDRLLHYRMLDVSSFKIIMQAKYNVIYQKKEVHRAFDDIQASIAELQYYLEWFKENAGK